MGQLDQFIKTTFAIETSMVTQGAAAWQLPPEIGMIEVRLDGLILVHDPTRLATLPPPWSLFRQAEELVIELKMQGDHLDMLAVDRAWLRRQAWQVKRREDKAAPVPWDGETPLAIVASHVPAVLRQRRAVERVAPGVYRVDPAPFAFLWIAANELPLADELVPFLVARSGAKLDELVRWVKTHRPIEWLMGVLEFLPMSISVQQELRDLLFSKTDDPAIRARRRDMLRHGLEAEPEVGNELRLEGQREGQLKQQRASLRSVLAVRRLVLSADDEARIDACHDLDVLGRWLGQAVVAVNVAEALR